ncbi:hypothetical protein KDK_15560 [Dictyobacter kobayashii]|uniref:Uncharacterized protein n=1 Tax=Dictyobacter kobayashii TaxID=2014872 RepID=A0A402AF91_9CHLR|nr:hypothetical protein KDK_15560 [Dictyobacter kobayashii]
MHKVRMQVKIDQPGMQVKIDQPEPERFPGWAVFPMEDARAQPLPRMIERHCWR